MIRTESSHLSFLRGSSCRQPAYCQSILPGRTRIQSNEGYNFEINNSVRSDSYA